MARMKLEWQHGYNQREGIGLRDRVLSSLPRLAPLAHRLRPLANLGARGPAKRLLGLATARPLPRWHAKPWRDEELRRSAEGAPGAALFVDTFSRWFEPENARAAARLLDALPGAHEAVAVSAPPGERPLCCGRTFLSAGRLDEAREEGARLLAALTPLARAGTPIVGLEPSCLYTLRDELPALFPGEDARRVAEAAVLLEEYLDAQWTAGFEVPLRATTTSRVLVHGHCHQKAFGGVDAALAMLRRVPGLTVDTVESGCCGMAGSFGYHAEHYEMSMAMGELTLLPAVRQAESHTRIVADGTSCRAQISDGTERSAVHAAVVLADALA